MKRKRKGKNQKKIVVLFNAEEINLMIAAASIFKKYRNASVIPVTVKTINDWPAIEQEIHQEVSDFWQERDSTVEDIKAGEASFYILGLFPQDSNEMEILFQFCEQNIGRIKLWADDHIWPEFKHLKILRSMCRNLIVSPNRTVLQIIKKRGFFVHSSWISADYAMVSGEDNIMANDLSFRIISAISVAKSIESLTGKKTMIPVIYLCMSELVYNLHYQELEIIVEKFPHMINRTTWSEKRIKPYGNNPLRPIGYLNLGNVPEYTDVLGIMEEGLERYPWLCTIIANGRTFTASAKMDDLGDIINGYKDLDNGTLLKVLAGEVNTYGYHKHDPKEFEI